MPPCWYPFPDRRRPRIARRSLAPLSTGLPAPGPRPSGDRKSFDDRSTCARRSRFLRSPARSHRAASRLDVGDLWCKLCQKVITKDHLQSAKHHRWYQWHVEEPKSHGPATNHTGRCNWFASTSCPRLYTWHRANSAIWRCPACSTGIYDTSLRQLN